MLFEAVYTTLNIRIPTMQLSSLKQITYVTACLKASKDEPGLPYLASKYQAVFL